jgi:predicted regulator of Ras-like GTPase activity (Roadblock/LC7/MglB family)
MAPAKPAAMTPAVTTTAPPAAPVAAPAPAYSALGELLGQPSKMDWTPAEVVEFILGLPGVSGAIFAASDGLLVAGRAPVPLKADMLAAFLPQIFNRVAEYTLEAQLGAVRAMKLWTGHAPCVIYKAGRLYLAVLPRAGQALPEATLERIATEMGQDKR